MDEVLKRIDMLRKEHKWSYYMLALEAGLTQSTITNMFYRNTQPSIRTLRAICGAFGMPVSEFFAQMENVNKNRTENSDETEKSESETSDELSLIDAYRKLSLKDKLAVHKVLTLLNESESNFNSEELSKSLNIDFSDLDILLYRQNKFKNHKDDKIHKEDKSENSENGDDVQ